MAALTVASRCPRRGDDTVGNILIVGGLLGRVGAERPAEAGSGPPHRLRARTIPTRCADPAVVSTGMSRAASRFLASLPGESGPMAMSVLYWY
jgi:hypothetical protein